MNHKHQEHKPDRLGGTQARSGWRWWAVGLAGMTGLTLAAVGGPTASAADAVGRTLTAADDRPSDRDHRNKGEDGKHDTKSKERGGKEPNGTPVPCDTDALIAAITLANARDGAVLDLAKNCTYLLTADIDGNGLPAITAPITLNGGKNTTIERAATADPFRILTVDTGGNLTLNHLIITGGQTTSNGGGIFVRAGGTLITNHSTIARNIAQTPGGGIANSGTTRLAHSRVENNSTNQLGGGVNNIGLLEAIKSHIDMNDATIGGGIYGSGNTVIKDGSISGNQATVTGGLFLAGANGIVTNTRITENSSAAAGAGGVQVEATAQLTMRHVNLSDNTSPATAGGLLVAEGDNFALVEDSLIKNNTATDPGGGVFNSGETVLRRTKVVGNQASQGGGIQNFGTLSLFTSKVVKNIAVTDGGGIFNSGGVVNLNTATGTVVIKNRPNNCVDVPGCAG
ncbi:right-handed parallel beta-helix repeat-containing protein [Salinispora tropica]|uniref:right-handed parallel beta-helix repeat-containing protein n=1 Tax=Salinispora tropica TaxID=168695 RepID=UPI00048D7AC0|nr:right-handed parallel beta-helix repeat-containing protein [Salinispora tropica]